MSETSFAIDHDVTIQTAREDRDRLSEWITGLATKGTGSANIVVQRPIGFLAVQLLAASLHSASDKGLTLLIKDKSGDGVDLGTLPVAEH